VQVLTNSEKASAGGTKPADTAKEERNEPND
jgi:hypothetical protein